MHNTTTCQITVYHIHLSYWFCDQSAWLCWFRDDAYTSKPEDVLKRLIQRGVQVLTAICLTPKEVLNMQIHTKQFHQLIV